jgi:tetratricopeptide (TPR) repeat protein
MALALDPRLPKACNNLGLALQQTGQAQAAMEQFEHALVLDPAYPDPHMNWGNALGNLGRFAEAISHWEAALRLNPNLAVAKEDIARARQLQQAAEAKK